MFSSSFGCCFRLKKPNPKISKLTIEKVGSIDDLLIEILVHLPLKPLFRFKTVSKHWNSIISDPKFQLMRNQVLQAHSNSRAAADLIFQYYYQDFWRTRRFHLSLDRSPPRPHRAHNTIPNTQTIFHSCNGLFVLKSILFAEHDYYYINNPTTNKKTTTPLLKDEILARTRDRVRGMYLAFDPSKSLHYKVVCVWQLDWWTHYAHQFQFDVYSSETASWERCPVIDAGYFDFDNGVYWNGAIHWLSLFRESIYFNPDDHHHDGMPRVMPKPPYHAGCFENKNGYFFGESFGRLHFAALNCKHNPNAGIHVYEMRRDYSGWFLKYEVDNYPQYLRNRCTVRHLFCVVRGWRDEDDSFLVLGTEQGEIISYNLVHNTCETIKVKGKKGGFFDFNSSRTKLFPYIESPCSV